MAHQPTEFRAIGQFICARREATHPDDFPSLPSRRRHVPHLSQADLAELVDVSTVVISQVEQGRYPNLNRSLLQRLATALRFTQQQSIYVFGLLESRPQEQKSPEAPPAWLVTSIRHTAHPVMIVNPAFDVVEANARAAALFNTLSPHLVPGKNAATALFGNPTARAFFENWEPFVISLVSGMRMHYAINPAWRDYIDREASALGSRNAFFHELWNRPDPLVPPTLEKTFHHPRAGVLNVLQILSDIVELPGLTKIEFLPADEATKQKLEDL